MQRVLNCINTHTHKLHFKFQTITLSLLCLKTHIKLSCSDNNMLLSREEASKVLKFEQDIFLWWWNTFVSIMRIQQHESTVVSLWRLGGKILIWKDFLLSFSWGSMTMSLLRPLKKMTGIKRVCRCCASSCTTRTNAKQHILCPRLKTLHYRVS